MGETADRRKVSPREVALRALYGSCEKGSFSDIALSRQLSKSDLGERDVAFATELLYGTLRRLNTIDWMIERISDRPVRRMSAWVRNILRIGVFQLAFMDKVPEWAAVDECVKLAYLYAHRGVAGYVNALLRTFVREKDGLVSFPSIEEDPVRHISLAYSHPEWIVERWLGRFGLEETIRLCELDNLPPAFTIRVNTLRILPVELKKRLEDEGQKVTFGRFLPEALTIDRPGRIEKLGSFSEGLFTVQDEASMLSTRILDPKADEFVIDACGAPGGKATHMAELTGDAACIVCADINEYRLKLVRENCSRLGISGVRPIVADAASLGSMFHGQADKVLLDAPCSGMGVLRRNPDARWRKRKDDLPSLSARQIQLFMGVADCLKEGGVLVYSVCSFEPEETVRVIDDFLRRRTDFEPSGVWPYLPGDLKPYFDLEATHLTLLPQLHGTDGFFIARFRKR